MDNWSPKSTSTDIRVAVLGAGIIGLTCAVELAARGAMVTIFEKNEPGRGASWAAAGMLAPAYEAASEIGEHPRLFEFCLQGGAMWPDFADRLERACGHEIGYRPGPSLAVASTAEEAKRLDAIAQRLNVCGVACDVLDGDQVTAFEPSMTGNVQGALLLPTDGHVDNRLVIAGLLKVCAASPRIEIQSDTEITAPTRLLGDFDTVLCTAGWQSAGLLIEAAMIEPIGGQMLSVAPVAGGPTHTIRSGSTYIVPKSDRIIIGATMEPGVVRGDTEAGAIAELKQIAVNLCPALADAETLDTWAGVRPGTPDHAPIIGQVDGQSMFVATGHYRNGILLAPLTAKVMADMILNADVSELATAFLPDRFVQA